jgi:hypothetical protein
MSRTLLWVITALLVIGAILISFVYMPSRQTELQRKGVRGYGTIVNKDSRPIADGSMIYFVTFIFQDEQKKNYQVTVQMLDKGRWDSLSIKQDIKDVRYLPENPAKASIPGGERMVAPHSSALSFLAWSMFFAALVTGYMAFIAAKPEPKKPQNKVTIARH